MAPVRELGFFFSCFLSFFPKADLVQTKTIQFAMDFILFFFLSVRLPSTLRYTISNKSQWFVFLSPFQCCSPDAWAGLQEEDLGQRQHLNSGWGIERALVQTNLWTLGLWLQSRALGGVVSQALVVWPWLDRHFIIFFQNQRVHSMQSRGCVSRRIRVAVLFSSGYLFVWARRAPPRCHVCSLHLPPFKLWMTRCIHQRAGARFQ